MKLNEKQQFVKSFEEEIQSSASVIIASYQGIKANASNVLRKELKNAGCTLKVVKNRLAKRSLENAGKDKYEELFGSLKGPVAVILASEDPSAGLKVFKNHCTENEIMDFKAAIIGENFLDGDKLKKLADLPDRTVLIAQVVNVFNAPIQNLHTVLSGVIKKLIYALKDLQEKKPQQTEPAVEEKQEAAPEEADSSQQVADEKPAASEDAEGNEKDTSEPAVGEKQEAAPEASEQAPEPKQTEEPEEKDAVKDIQEEDKDKSEKTVEGQKEAPSPDTEKKEDSSNGKEKE